MAEKIEKENIQNATVASRIPHVTNDGNQENSTVNGKKATPVFAIESLLEGDDAFETAQDYEDKTIKAPMTKFSSRPPEPPDNVSVANADVILRRPQQLGRYLSSGEPPRGGHPPIQYSHSTSDLGKYQHPHGRPLSKDSRSMILPIPNHNRPRSPYVHSNSYSDGLHLMGHQYSNSNTTLTRPSTPQERFVPYIAGDGGGFQNGNFQNGGFQNGGFQNRDIQNGGFQNGGFHNGGFQNGGYGNGGYVVSNGDIEHYKQNRLTPVPSSVSDHHLPTHPEAKKKLFTDILSTSGSTIYALLVLTVGISIYVIDSLDMSEEDRIYYLAEGFSLALVCMAMLYLLYLIIDISIYKHRKDQFDKLMENLTAEQIELKETSEGIAYDVTLHKALALRKQLDHRYCFNMDRHSSNFYLKVGAAGFCFGHLIHSFLLLTYRGILFNSADSVGSECLSGVSFTLEILYPLYSVVLLFFIFKYSNVIINRHRDFHRFGFMHCLSASLCFWVFTIFRETAEYIHHQNSKYPSDDYAENDTIVVENVANKEKALLGIITPRRFTKMCENDELNVIYQNYSPYMYPFSVEYSILVVGILYIVWINIGLCAAPETEDHHGEDTRECKNHKSIEHESNFTIHADCHAANKGLFGGFIVLVFAIVSVILFFITYYNSLSQQIGGYGNGHYDDIYHNNDNLNSVVMDAIATLIFLSMVTSEIVAVIVSINKIFCEDLAYTGYLFNGITGVVIMFCMIFATIFAYVQMVKLDVNESAHNTLDNFLCLMCLPAFFVNGLFSIIPAFIYNQPLEVVSVIFETVQVLIQTTFIIDGMTRSSNTKELRKKKPGREFVTFLVICNVAMWIMQTFEVKSHGLNQYRQDFYSKEVWSIVGHICLPLMMFYRFHSSVCIGDIWKYAYIPSGH